MREYLKANEPEQLERFNQDLDQHTFSTFTTVDAKTGKVLYTHGVDLTNCGGAWIPGVGYGGGRNARHYNPYVFGCTVAQKDVIVFCTTSGADKGWRVWPSGGYENRSIAVHNGKTGKLLWKKACNYRTRPVWTAKTRIASEGGRGLRGGEMLSLPLCMPISQRPSAATGVQMRPALARRSDYTDHSVTTSIRALNRSSIPLICPYFADRWIRARSAHLSPMAAAASSHLPP